MVLTLERDKEALLDYYGTLTLEALGALTPEEGHQLYKMLKLRASVSQEGAVKIAACSGRTRVFVKRDVHLGAILNLQKDLR